MAYIFIELYRENAKWAAMPTAERSAYIETVIGAVGQIAVQGVEVIAYGENEQQIEHRAEYDYFAIYQLPDAIALSALQDAIQSSGWYGYFDQINVAGERKDPAEILRLHATNKSYP